MAGNNRGEKGGVAMLMVIGFMVFSIALVTSSLSLTSALSSDSRVKTDVLHRQYCGLAAIEYVRYLTLDPQRWADWWIAHPDGLETIYPCGGGATQGIDIDLDRDPDSTAATSDEAALQGLSLWPLPAYSNRRIQPVKTVQPTDESQSSDKTPFAYTITLSNRSSSDVPLNKIHDNLPPSLQYDCTGTSTVLFPDGVTQQTVVPEPDPGELGCPTDRHIVWDVTFLPPLKFAESVTLTFGADRDGGLLPQGNYCNEAWAEPGDDNTTTGKTAQVKVGGVAQDDNVCVGADAGVTVEKKVSNIVSVTPSGDPLPFDTYQLTVEYTITVNNVGAVTLNLGPRGATEYGIRDLLPLQFCYLESSAVYQGANLPDPVRNIPQGSKTCPDSSTRQQLDWDFDDAIPSGDTRVLTYQATALVGAGDYWSDLLVNFAEFTNPPIYTWPTAPVVVRDKYTVNATIDGRIIADFEVSVGDGSGEIEDYIID